MTNRSARRFFSRRYVAATLFAFVALLGLWLKVFSPVHVDAVQIDRGPVVRVSFGRGTIESQREAAVGFDLIGRLSDVLVDEGARVSLGQELARLETDQAQADLRSAQMGVAAARASLLRLAAEEERARSLLVTAERDAARTETLLASGTITTKSHDDAVDRLRLARAELDRVLASRSEATRSIDVAVGGAEQRRMTMVRATLLAPFDGLVIRRLREPGDTVAVGSTVLRIADLRRVYVSAAVDETVLPKLAVEQPSKIQFPGSDEVIEGRVSRISWEADRQTHELLVEVTPDRLERRIAIGQRADVRIEIERREQALRLPVRMLQRDELGPYVYADRDGRIALVRVAIGLVGDMLVEISDGLGEADHVLGSRSNRPLPVGRRWVAP
ncbi:MAG: efflux RND transporter periplasmic adaptor subunit [Deltaproteobacteria bacterium]|nr:efflux RND transporter periplasmic adaptor subunit [Deltaproteobacteria bacterium]